MEKSWGFVCRGNQSDEIPIWLW